MILDDDDVYDYAVNVLGLIDPEDRRDVVRDWARDEGYVLPDEVSRSDVLDMMAEYGLGVDLPSPDRYHYDAGHSGTIRWCIDPICEGGRNNE